MRFGFRRHAENSAQTRQIEEFTPATPVEMIQLESVAEKMFNTISAGTRAFPAHGLMANLVNGHATLRPAQVRHGAPWEEVIVFRADTGEMHIQRKYHQPGTEFEAQAGELCSTTDFTLEAGAPVMTTLEMISGLDDPTVLNVQVGESMSGTVCEGMRKGFNDILLSAGVGVAATGAVVGRASVPRAA